ncbi:MAG: cold shock domain-containing protein [Anaerolineae bacterium]
MPYRDELLTCEKCGETFVYRVEEQRLQEELGFEPEKPERCPNCREEIEAGPGLRAGVVKWYSDEKHFGFITQKDGTDVFFHRTNIEGDPANFGENAQVWYELTTTDRGPQAVNVHLRE